MLECVVIVWFSVISINSDAVHFDNYLLICSGYWLQSKWVTASTFDDISVATSREKSSFALFMGQGQYHRHIVNTMSTVYMKVVKAKKYIHAVPIPMDVSFS